jgi:Osmosensitive K+ channel histidine kinase
MVKVNTRLASYLIIDVILLVFALFNLSLIDQRAKAPFIVERQNEHLIVTNVLSPEACQTIRRGDRILLWNQVEIRSADGMEFLSDLSTPGEKIIIQYVHEEIQQSGEIQLVRYYDSPRFALIMAIVAFVFWSLAVFVAWNRLDGSAAYSLHWALIGLALSSLLTQGHISHDSISLIASRIGFLFSYIFTAGLFLFFSMVYPREKFGSTRTKLAVIFLPIFCCIGITAYRFLHALQSPEAIEFYLRAYDVYHFIIVLCGAGMIASVIDSYKRAQSMEDRARLQWILWGIVVGQVPFLFLIVIPQILISKDLVPEEYAAVFFLATVFSFAISFVKYRFLDIQVMINRSIVYTVLSLLIGLIYTLIVVLGISLIGGELQIISHLLILSTSIILVWLMNPLRLRLQRVVDETLFPARVHYGKTLSQLSDQIHKALSIDDLAKSFVDHIAHAIPFGSIAFYIKENGGLICRYSHGDIMRTEIKVPPGVSEHIASQRLFALSSAINNPERDIDLSYTDWLKQIGFSLCIPMISESGYMQGLITANPRSIKDRLPWEEVELLMAITSQASKILDRLRLQKGMILEQEERKKVEELNILKSYFVSSVSHELRTPLTSIRMFAETLQHGTIQSEKTKQEYYTIINRESERLSRLIDNVLDFSRIERGVKEYHFVTTDMKQVVRKAILTMKYQFQKSKIKFSFRVPKNIPNILADMDALEEVIINLLSNAMKYSGSKKEVKLHVHQMDNELLISVEDKGIGIPFQDRDKIFERFYRSQGAYQAKGMGLGLTLVKHIVEAHDGKIEVKSKIGKGSTFIIRLPLMQKSTGESNETNTHHRRR